MKTDCIYYYTIKKNEMDFGRCKIKKNDYRIREMILGVRAYGIKCSFGKCPNYKRRPE